MVSHNKLCKNNIGNDPIRIENVRHGTRNLESSQDFIKNSKTMEDESSPDTLRITKVIDLDPHGIYIFLFYIFTDFNKNKEQYKKRIMEIHNPKLSSNASIKTIDLWYKILLSNSLARKFLL